MKNKNQLEEEEEIDLVERVDNLRKSYSAVNQQRSISYNMFNRSASNSNDFNITRYEDKQRSGTIEIKSPQYSKNNQNQQMFAGLLP